MSKLSDKMTSPSFWAKTISRMRTSGKGVTWDSWADAVNFDLAQEITNQIHMADRTFVPAKKAAVRDFQAAIKAAEECMRLSKSAAERVKIHQKKYDKLPDF